MKKSPSNIVRGTHATIKRAWLLTWEWAGAHAGVKDKFVAIISSRSPEGTVKQILQQYYVSSYLSLHEQFSYAKSSKNFPYKVQNATMKVSERLQKAASLPPQVHFGESIIIGGNPWLWGRIVFDLETWIDNRGVEHLRWKERENIYWDGGDIKSEWKDGYLEHQR